MNNKSQRYISDKLVHLVGRGKNAEEQYTILLKILKMRAVTHPPHDPNSISMLTVRMSAKLSRNEMYNPDMICFCDIPLGDLKIHVKKYSPFGISFEKNFIVENGGCPVFYLPINSKVVNGLKKSEYFDAMLKEYHNLCGCLEKSIKETAKNDSISGLPKELKRFIEFQRFLAHQVFGYLKFFDHNLPDHHIDNYYFEREWRIIGNLKFEINHIKSILIPKIYLQRIKKDFYEYTGEYYFTDLNSE